MNFKTKNERISFVIFFKITSATKIALKQLVAHRINVMVHQMAPVIDSKTGPSLEYRHLIKTTEKEVWQTALANEFGRLLTVWDNECLPVRIP